MSVHSLSQISHLSNRVFGPLAVVFALAAWGASFSVGKIILEHADVWALTLVRLFVAFLGSIPFLIKYHQPIKRKDWLPLFTFAMLSLPITLLLQFHGLLYTSASVAALAIGIEVPFVMMWLFILFGEKPKIISIIIAIMALVGLVFVVGEPEWGKAIGVALVLTAGAAFSLGTVISKDLFRRYNSAYISGLTFLLATVVMIPIWAVVSDTDLTALPNTAWMGMIYLGLVATLFAQTLWNWGVAHISAVRAAQYIALEPFLGAVIAIWWLDEYWYWGTLVGGALIVGSMLINSLIKDDENAH